MNPLKWNPGAQLQFQGATDRRNSIFPFPPHPPFSYYLCPSFAEGNRDEQNYSYQSSEAIVIDIVAEIENEKEIVLW